MGTTTNRSLRYPAGGAAPAVPLDMKNLADDVDAQFGVDTGWIRTGITAAAGGSITVQRYRIERNKVWIYVAGTLSTAAAANINSSASPVGDYVNADLAILPSAIVPAETTQPLNNGASGGNWNYAANSGGTIQLTAGPPGVTTATAGTTAWSAGGSYLLD